MRILLTQPALAGLVMAQARFELPFERYPRAAKGAISSAEMQQKGFSISQDVIDAVLRQADE